MFQFEDILNASFIGPSAPIYSIESCSCAEGCDCEKEDDWNLSFLYYPNTFWNPNWGGKLRFYSEIIHGGILDFMNEYETGTVDFVPNRLLMFDGRLPHGAEAPHESARYIDRKSIVIRGDEIVLKDERDKYAYY